MASIYDYSVPNTQGGELSLADYSRVLLFLVNIFCCLYRQNPIIQSQDRRRPQFLVHDEMEIAACHIGFCVISRILPNIGIGIHHTDTPSACLISLFESSRLSESIALFQFFPEFG